MHNTYLQPKAQQMARLTLFLIILASLLFHSMPAQGKPLPIGEGDPILFPPLEATATSTPKYDPPRAPRPGEPTALPTVAPTPTPGDLKPVVEHSVKPDNLGLITYTVVKGDSVWGIAEMFGLKPDSIIWANPELQGSQPTLMPGQQLWIPPLDGAVHTIVAGDTLLGIAGEYGVMMEDIVNCYYNDITVTSRLRIGDKIFIPGARSGPTPSVGSGGRTQIQYAVRPSEGAATGTGTFIWPVAGRISQGYKADHRAIDISGWTGRQVVAADTGFVVQCGWDNSGYGNVLVIDHGSGVLTRYAHLNSFSVKAGDAVKQGDPIGFMGSTGRSTGPHLHFEIIIGGYQKNPIDYLP